MKRPKKNYPLFVLLLFCFLILTLIPSLFFLLYFGTAAYAPVEQNLKEQCIREIDTNTTKFKDIIGEYRHKAYLLSSEQELIETLQNGKSAGHSDSEIYKTMFNVMKGDVYLAAAHLVSADGKIKYSTHYFPGEYNPRSNSGVYSIFTEMENGSISESYLLPSTRKENKNHVSLTIAKKIYNSGSLLGYVFIDVFEEVFIHAYKRPLFSDLILVDSSSFLAYSLITRELYGDFSRFPVLTSLPAVPPSEQIYRKNDYFIALSLLPDSRFFIAGILDGSPYFENIHKMLKNLALLLFIPLILSIVLALLFSKLITSPVKSLLKTMKSIRTENLIYNESSTRISDFTELSGSYNLMIDEIRHLIAKIQQEEIKLREAQRKALEAQINPHFLSNTLGTIKSLAKLHKQHEITEIVTELNKLLRHSIGKTGTFIPVKEAVELAESWLRIMRIRFGEKLKTATYLQPECASLFIPAFTVQPFLENAVIHGLEPKTGEWFLSLSVTLERQYIFISIKDNGNGFPENILSGGFDRLQENGHTGLYNIHKRLELLYAGKASIRINTSKDGTEVRLRIPVQTESGLKADI